MGKQHSYDFKLSAVNLYLKLNSIRKVSELFNCPKTTLHRWIQRYFDTEDVERLVYKSRKSILTNNILKYIETLIKNKPSISLSNISHKINEKYNVSISVSYLFYIIKYKLDITYKQLRVKYYPEKKLPTLTQDKLYYYNEILNIDKRKLISIDETGFYLSMHKSFGRCSKGERCYKTIHKYPFVKFNFICAIKYGKIIGYKLYQKNTGGIDVNKFNEFYNKFIKDKYKNNLIIMDNAKFHKALQVKYNIEKTKNRPIYILPYNAKLNPIENLFSQIKNYVKDISPSTYEELKITIDNIIKTKINKEHLKNYFNYLFIQAQSYIESH